MNKLMALAIAGALLTGAAEAQAPAPPADPSTATPAVVQPKSDPDLSAAARTRTAAAGMARALNDVTAGMGVKSASGRLKSAPKVNPQDLHDQNNTAWRRQADQYWGVPGANLR